MAKRAAIYVRVSTDTIDAPLENAPLRLTLLIVLVPSDNSRIVQISIE
jgi:hypothetical protein